MKRNKASPVWRRIMATFMLATMLMTSMAVTAIATPTGATVVDLTVAGGGSGQGSSVCVLHSSYDADGHFLVCDTHTGSGTFNGKAHTNGRVDYKAHNIQYFGEAPTCNILTPVGYWYCADGCGYQKSGRLEHQSEDVWRESGNARHYKVCSVCKVCWTADGFHVINGVPVNEMEDHTIYGKSVCDICGLEVDLSNHTAEPAWDTGVSPCPICGDKRPFLQAMWLEKSSMDLVSNDSDYVDFRIYGSADRMSLLTGTTGFAWVYYPSDTADIFDIGEPVQIGSGVDAAGNTYRDYRITLSYKDSTVATAGIGQQTFALHYYFGSSTANATAGGVAEASKWSPANAWGVTPNLYLLRTFGMSGGICEPVGTPIVTYDKQVGGYAQNVTIKTTWYNKRVGSAEVALFDKNGNQVTEWAAAAPSGGAWEYTSVISPNVNLSTAQTYTVRCKNYLGGYGSVDCVIQPTDMAGPNLVSDTDLTAEWAKTKAYTAKGQDAGVGSVELSFDGDADYQMGNDIGSGTYSREYVFTGDVYSEQSHTFYMRDALGNVGTGSIKVNRLDNTAPTVTGVISALDSTGHRAKLNVTYNDAHPTLGEGSGVAELAVSKSNDVSNLNWQNKDEAMYVEKAGKYYVFAKDAAGNVSSSYAVDVAINNYMVKTEFVSGTEGRDLPTEVSELLPLDQTGLSIGQSVNPPMALGKTVVEHHEALELGEWKLVSWDKESVTVQGDGQHFLGSWEFKPYTATVSYTYVSGTEGRELPAGIVAASATVHNVGDVVKAPDVVGSIYRETTKDGLFLGTWTMMGWDKDSAVVPNEGVMFTATWEFVPATSTVRYRYESGTEGRDLPAGIVAAGDATYNVGTVAKAPDVLGSTYKETTEDGLFLGTWTMTGWDKDFAIVPNEEIVFIGTWTFKPETATVSYKFTSGTEGRALPASLQPPAPSTCNVGDGVMPSVPKTVHDEKYESLTLGTWTLTGWDKNSAIVSNKGVTFTATWEFVPATSTVHYRYESGTVGRELPAGIIPADAAVYNVGSVAKAPDVLGNTYKETSEDGLFLGTWTMTGWDKDSAIVPNEEIVFIGKWEFKHETAFVSYRFTSGTEGRELPASLPPPAASTYNVGDDVTPSVPETVHAEKYESMTLGTWTLMGWDKNSAIVSNAGVTFTATWEFVPATSTVHYRYESGTEGRDLPAEIVAASDAVYNVGSDVKAPDVIGNTYKETTEDGLWLGTWTMTGWDRNSAIVPNEEVVFIGKWVYKPESASVSYKFTSGTEGRELPQELVNQAFTKEQNVGTNASIPNTIPTTYDEYKNSMKLGTWKLEGWDKLAAVVPNAGVTFTATWKFVPDTASVSYRYESGTEGRELPASLQPPASRTYNVGTGVVPSVPETTHDEKYESMTLGTWTLTGWDKNFALVPNEGVTFTATWEFIPAAATVHYRYESGTEGRELPAEIVAASDAVYNVGSSVKAPDVLGDTYKETSEKGLFLGTWTMSGWDKSSAVVPNEGVVFVGKWVFKPETAPVSYKFTSGTEGRELPQELVKLMATVERNVGTDACILDTIPTTYDEYKNGLKVGTWTLKGWDKTTDVVSNVGISFNATWVYKQDDYSVTYRFVDKDGKDLPEDILKLLPAAATDLENGSTVKTPEVKTKSVGRWSFKGWDISEASVSDKDVVVTGTWAYTPRYYYTTPQPELPKKMETPDTFDAGIGFYAISGISSMLALAGISLLKKRKDDEI